MASKDSDTRFDLARLVGAMLAVLIAAGVCASPAWADDDPPKKDSPTTQSADKKEEGAKPKTKAELDAAKRAAMASIGKNTPKGVKKNDKAGKDDPEKAAAESAEKAPTKASDKTPPNAGRPVKAGNSPRTGEAAGKHSAANRQPPPPPPGRSKMRGPRVSPNRDRNEPGRRHRRDRNVPDNAPEPDEDERDAAVGDDFANVGAIDADGGTDDVGAVGEATSAPISDVTTRVIFDIDVADPESRSYRIDYVDTPWSDVLADFSRMSGLSWLNQPDPPLMDNLTFSSPGVMTYKEALEQLNELLLKQPLNKYLIQRKDRYLTINRLPDLIREIPPEKMYDTFEEFEAANPDPFDIVLTYFDVPEGWSPYQIIEEFRPRFSDTYGTQVVGDRIELSGLAQEHYRFRDVVLKLAQQTPPPIDPRAMQTFDLKVAKVADVQTLLKLAFPVEAPGGRGGKRGPGIDPKAEQAKSISVFADVRNNRLFVKAPPDALVEIEKMIRDLDGGNGAEPPVMKFLTIENTSAASIMNTLKPIFTAQKAAIAKQKATEWVPPEVEAAAERDIFADPATNIVTLIGSPTGVADAARQVKELDVYIDSTRTEIVELVYADAKEVAQLLPGLLSPTPRGSVAPRIIAKGQTQLLITCAKPDWPDIQMMIQKLDVPKDDEPKEHFVKLEAATPSAVVPMLQQIMNARSAGSATPQRRAPVRRAPGQKGRPAAPQQAATAIVTGAGGTTFVPDDASMTLLVVCTDKDWPRIEELIKRFDEHAKVVQEIYHTIKLEAANAADVVAMLQQMFPPETGINTPQCVITADNYNNTINFFATQEYIDKVTPFIKELDKNTDGDMTVIHLENAQAAEIAPILQQMFPGSASTVTTTAEQRQPVRRGGRQAQRRPQRAPSRAPSQSESTVSIIAEPMTNSLFVRAPQKELKRIQELVAQMEEASMPTRIIFPCINRPAEEIVATVQSLMGGGSTTQLIRGPKGRAAQTITTASNSPLKLVPDGDRIIIEGPQRKVAEAIQWIERIDIVMDDELVFRKVYVSDALEVEKQLRAMLAMSPSSPPKAQASRKGGARPRTRAPSNAASDVQIYANEWESTLSIRATAERMEEVLALLAEIESDPTAIDPTAEPIEPAPPFFVHKLKHKTAFDISWTVEDLVNTDGKSTIRLDEGPDERTVIVRGCKPAQKDFVIEVIQMFDVPDSDYGDSGIFVIDPEKHGPETYVNLLKRYKSKSGRPVEFVDSGDMFGAVQVIDIHEGEEDEESDSAEQATEEAGEPVSFHVPGMMPGMASRVLECIVAASLAQAEPAPKAAPQDEAKKNDTPPAKPVDAPVRHEAAKPRVLFSSTTAEADAESKEDNRPIKVWVDPITGKIVVDAPEAEREGIQKYIDEVMPDKPQTVYRVFPLKYTDVNSAATLLTSVFNVSTPARPQRQQRQPQQQKGQQNQQGQKGQQTKNQQQRQQRQPVQVTPARIKVVPDPRTRSLFVAAPQSDIPLITEMLRQIDTKVPIIEGSIRIFQLENLDASQVVQNLREVLGLTSGSAVQQSRTRRPTRRGTPQQQAQQRQEQLQLQGADGQGTVVSSDAVKLTADTQTNSVIAKGEPATLTLVGDLIKQLEEQTNTSQVEMRRITLNYASASDVASIVKDLIGSMLGSSGGRRGPRGGGSRSGVSVNADTRTNSVIAAGPMKDLDRVEQIVKDLDVDDTGGSVISQIPVKGDVRAYADTLKTLFVGRGRESDVIISPNAETGVLVVKAPKPKIAEIEKQVALMDEKVESDKARRPIPLMVADAETIAPKLQELFSEQARGRGVKGKVSIKGSKSNNTLYVQCPDDMFEEIKQVAMDMDKVGPMQVKAFQLQHASAVGVHKQLETLMVQAVRSKGMGDIKLDLIGILPDSRTNSLIVSGGPVTFSLIDQILKEVDVQESTPVKRETKTYTFNNAIKAQEIARNITDLFRGESARTTGVEAPTVTFNAAGNVLTVKANAAQHEEIEKNIIEPVQAAIGEAMQDYQVKLEFARADEIKPVLEEFMNKWRQSRGNKPQDAFSVTADPNSNLLLVNCSPSTKAVFDKQLAELDTETAVIAGARTLRTYRCKFANIYAVRDAITQAFRRTGRVPERDQVNVSLDGNTNAVVVMANDKNHEQIAKMMESMDLEDTGGRLTRIFEFKYAEPWQVPRVINEQFRTTSRNPKDQVTASYINGTMSIVVTANPDNMDKVAEMMAEVDRPSAGGQKVTKFVTLQNARADTLANMLNRAYQARVPRPRTGQYDVNYLGDVNTNQIIVTAPEDQIEELLTQIADLDVIDTERVTRAFQVKYAAPWTLAGIIANQFRSSSRNPYDQVVANYEDGTNSIIVTANKANMEKVADFIERADVPSADGGRTTRSFQLKYAYTWRMADIINRQFQSRSRNVNDQVTATFEEGTNSVIVTANEENMKKVVELIEAADVAGTDIKTTKFIKVEYARADELAQKITEAFQAKTTRDRQGRWPVTISADLGTNNLIVTAMGDKMAEVEAMVAELDVEQSEDQIRKVFKLTYADPGSVSRMIQSSFRPQYRNPSPRDIVTSSDDWTTNSVIVTASPANMKKIEQLIAEMDQQGDTTRSNYVLEVQNSNAEQVASALQQIFDAANRGRRSQQGSVTIRAIPGTTKLAVNANVEELKQIKELITQIDVEGGRSVHTVVMPELVSAKSVAESVNKLFGTQSGRRDGPNAEYHEATNTLLVHATDAEFDKINKQVIEVLSNQEAVGILQIYKIPLQHALADEVAKTLQDFFDKKSGNQRSRGGRGGWWGGGETAAQQVEDQVSIIAEPTSNMLIVYCTESTKEIIDDLIKDIDTDEPPGGAKIMEMVALKNMDASEMLDILTEYLKVSKRTQDDSNTRNVPWWWDREVGNDDEKTVLAGDMRLKAVESMNAIILVGKPADVADAKMKIEELDVPREGSPDGPWRIELANANAMQLAETLNAIFNDSSRNKGRGSSDKPPVIVPEETTNTLIVRAKMSDYQLIEQMAMQLDEDMKDEPSGVRILPVPVGRDVTAMAEEIEERLNDAEKNRQQTNKTYKPSMVSIGADTTANALLVAGSKAKFEEVKALVDQLVAMGPAGGRVRTYLKLDNISAERAKEIIEQLQESNSGSSSSGNRGGNRRGGRRGDATWTHDRRYEVLESGRTMSPVGYSASPIVCFAQIATDAAMAQTPEKERKAEPTSQPQRGPQSFKINKVDKTPAKKDKPAQDAKPAKRRGRGRRQGSQPQELAPQPKTNAAEPVLPIPTPAGSFSGWSDEAKTAIHKRLSGAPIEIVEAGSDGIFIDGPPEDVEILVAVLNSLNSSIQPKSVEYFKLRNSRATDLAKILQDVFQKIETPSSERTAGPEDKVDIIADPRTNGLYVAATEEKMKLARRLIQENEREIVDVETTFRSYTFKNRRVSEAGDVLQKMVSSYLKKMGMPDDSINVEIDPQTNTALITGGENDLKVVDKILELLDADLPEGDEGEGGISNQMITADIMVVPLRVAQADQLGTLLNELLQKAATGDTPMKDFIRRMRLLDEDGNPIAQIKLDRPIAVFGDPDSNVLIIASTKENCLIMKQVAMAFDKEPAKAPVEQKVIDLKYADATEVADQLSSILQDSEGLTQRPGKGDASGLPDGESGALVYHAVVKADPRTNQLLIVGRPESVAVLESIVEELDVKGLDVMPFEIVKLEYASATALEQALTDMMEQRAEALPKGTGPNADKIEKVIIKGDPRSESLIIAAKAARMDELRDLIKKLDVPASGLIDAFHTISLKNCNATELSEKLKELWEQRKSQREGGDSGLKLEIPAIVADDRSNSLILAASKSDYEAIKTMVEKIEGLPLNPMVDIYLVRLEFNSAQQLAPAFTTLFQKRAEMRSAEGKVRPEDEVAIEVDEVSNALIVAASRENYDVLMQKVRELDREYGREGTVEFFVCDNVSANRVKETLDELFQDGPWRPGATGDSQTAQDRNKVIITIDTRSNVIMASASPENMNLIREIYKRMNSVVRPWDAAVTKLITIKNADCVRIAAQVKEHFDELKSIRDAQSSGNSSSGFEITVFADERSNRIIIGGDKDGIDSAVDLIERLDVKPGDGNQFAKVYNLLEAPASKVGEMIDNIFQQRNESRNGATGAQVPNITVTVEDNDATNSLLVNASREDHVLIADLISELDRPSTIVDKARVFPLAKAKAEDVKRILDELYQGGNAGDSAASIVVVEDNRTNAVVVSAAPGELANIEELVNRLDNTEIRGYTEVGVFLCENEDAEKMAEILNEIMTGEGKDGGQQLEDARDPSSLLVSFQAKDKYGRPLRLEAVRENLMITYNTRSNSVVAVAPPASLKLIESLVNKLDMIQKRPVMVKVFGLQYADASKMIDLLEEMFAQDEGSEQEQEFQKDREVQVEGGTSSIGGVPTASSQSGTARRGTFGRPKTTFVADERTNSIVAAGWPEDIDVIADVIDQLDSQPEADRDHVVVTLVNMEAVDMQSALEQFFNNESQLLSEIDDALSPQQRMNQEVSIVAHEPSNQLILSTSPRYTQRVLSVVEQLDSAPPQVMIDVLIAEVTLDDRFEMGLEFALQQLRFSETAVEGGNGVLQSSHFDVIGGTDLGASPSGLAGVSFSITGEDFNFLVRALQSDSRLEIVQNPMIMCQDNQEANITIGQQVPFVRGTTTSDSGQVNANVEYEDVGIILEVEPQINPDGFVYLRVAPEISSISDSSIDLGNGTRVPVFNQRKAETTIAVKDGETVVIGGLITTQETESESKVPLLGDIPGLGMLFRTTSRSKQKTELLIALTPRIVRTVEDGRRVSIQKRDESGIITDNMKQSPMFRGLQVHPETMDEISDIESRPTYEPTLEPKAAPSTPVERPADEPRERYGPTTPRYGPIIPAADDDAVAEAETPARPKAQPVVFNR